MNGIQTRGEAPNQLAGALLSLIVRRVLPAFALVLGLSCAMEACGASTSPWVAGEHGMFEVLSVVGYWGLAASLGLWALAHGARWTTAAPPRFCWTMVVVLVAMGGRELDFHKQFTSGNISKTSYYIDPAVPASEKVAAVCAIALIIMAVSRLLWYCGSRLRADLLRGNRSARLVCGGIAVVLISKVIDRSATRLVDAFGGKSTSLAGIVSVFEEASELMIPVFFCAAAVAHLWSRPAVLEPESAEEPLEMRKAA